MLRGVDAAMDCSNPEDSNHRGTEGTEFFRMLSVVSGGGKFPYDQPRPSKTQGRATRSVMVNGVACHPN